MRDTTFVNSQHTSTVFTEFITTVQRMLCFCAFLTFMPSLPLATHWVDYIEDTDDIHEVCLFVQLVHKAGSSAIVEVLREDVAMGEIRSRYYCWHDQDHGQCTTTARSTTQWMYDRHIPAVVQCWFTITLTSPAVKLHTEVQGIEC